MELSSSERKIRADYGSRGIHSNWLETSDFPKEDITIDTFISELVQNGCITDGQQVLCEGDNIGIAGLALAQGFKRSNLDVQVFSNDLVISDRTYRSSMPEVPDNFQFLAANTRTLPFADASLELVLSHKAAIHYYCKYDRQNLRQCMSDLARVLKPNGKLLIDSGRPRYQATYPTIDYLEQYLPDQILMEVYNQEPLRSVLVSSKSDPNLPAGTDLRFVVLHKQELDLIFN